jgi:hypothetical protein
MSKQPGSYAIAAAMSALMQAKERLLQIDPSIVDDETLLLDSIEGEAAEELTEELGEAGWQPGTDLPAAETADAETARADMILAEIAIARDATAVQRITGRMATHALTSRWERDRRSSPRRQCRGSAPRDGRRRSAPSSHCRDSAPATAS